MKILIYRMFFHEKFVTALSHTDYNIKFISSERRSDETGIINEFYTQTNEAVIDPKIINDIVLRCRYLSSINYYDASRYVRKMWLCIEDYLKNNKYDLILTPPVDNYVADILFKIASNLKIPCFQPRQSPIKGLSRITNSIDNPIVREVSNDEIKDTVKSLRSSFVAQYQNINPRNVSDNILKILREFIKKIVFEFWKFKYKDSLSFHYNAIFPNKNCITFTSFNQLWAHKIFNVKLNEVKIKKKLFDHVVFWPLAMTPESALCYMNKDAHFSDYNDVINRVVNSLPNNILLLVKEHPSAIGFRTSTQYGHFRNKSNICLMSSELSTFQILQLADSTIINTSSTTGLESISYGKHVIALGSCHYSVDGVCDEIENINNINQWPNLIKKSITEKEIHLVFKKYLSNTTISCLWAHEETNHTNYSEYIHNTIKECIKLSKNYIPLYHVSK